MHPSEEEWVEYLYGEAAGDSRGAMAEHLESCRECRERLARWRAVAEQLDAWQVPLSRVRSLRLRAAVRWAAAAAVLVAVGFAVGRLWAVPSVDTAALHASLEASISRSLREDLAAEYRSSSDALKDELLDSLYLPLSSDIHALAEETGATREMVVRLADTFDTARIEDGLTLAAVVDELEARRAEDYARLSNDIYALADATGYEILLNRDGIAQLAAYTLETRVPRGDGTSQSPDERRVQ